MYVAGSGAARSLTKRATTSPPAVSTSRSSSSRCSSASARGVARFETPTSNTFSRARRAIAAIESRPLRFGPAPGYHPIVVLSRPRAHPRRPARGALSIVRAGDGRLRSHRLRRPVRGGRGPRGRRLDRVGVRLRPRRDDPGQRRADPRRARAPPGRSARRHRELRPLSRGKPSPGSATGSIPRRRRGRPALCHRPRAPGGRIRPRVLRAGVAGVGSGRRRAASPRVVARGSRR